MSEHGAEMILGMAKDLNDQYQRGFQMGVQEGRRQAFVEIQEVIKNHKGEENGD